MHSRVVAGRFAHPRTFRTLLAVIVALSLAACTSAMPPDGDGDPLTNLPQQPPSGADPRGGAATCVVTGGDFDDDVTVPEGVACTFTDVMIDGNLVIARGASVDSVRGSVSGNVLVYPNASYAATETTVGGNVQAERASSVSSNSAIVDGNVQTLETDTLDIVGGFVNGDVQPDDGGSVSLTDLKVGGNVQVYDNTGGVLIEENVIDGNLQCEGNVPAPTGGLNIVGGDAEGQCSGLTG